MSNLPLFKAIASATGYPKETVSQIFQAFILYSSSRLRQGEDVLVPRMMKIFPKDLPDRQGRNPSTGETMDIAASRKGRVRFSVTFNTSIQPDGDELDLTSEADSDVESPPATSAPATRKKSSTTTKKAAAKKPAKKTRKPAAKKSDTKTTSSVKEESVWYTNKGGTKMVELPASQFASLTPETAIYSEQTGWVRAKNVPELGYLFLD